MSDISQPNKVSNLPSKSRISDFFQKHGISKKDIAKSLIYFKSLSVVSYFGCMALCYKYRPLIRLFNSQSSTICTRLLNNIKTRYPNAFNKSYNFVVDKSIKVAESKYFKPIPTKLRLDAKKLTTAIAENIVFSKLLMPITIPLQFWIVIHALRTNTTNPNSNTNINNLTVTKSSLSLLSLVPNINSYINESTNERVHQRIVDSYQILFVDKES